MTASFPAPASRNAPCPCGSGRRYKDCHGSIVSIAAASAASESPAHGAAFDFDHTDATCTGSATVRALERCGGRLSVRAGAGPRPFRCAAHAGSYALPSSTISSAPSRCCAARSKSTRSIRDAHRNLRLLQHARHLRDREDALCRSVMPKLAAPLHARAFVDGPGARAMPAVVDIFMAETDAGAVSVAQRLMARLGADAVGGLRTSAGAGRCRPARSTHAGRVAAQRSASRGSRAARHVGSTGLVGRTRSGSDRRARRRSSGTFDPARSCARNVRRRPPPDPCAVRDGRIACSPHCPARCCTENAPGVAAQP